MVFKFAYFVESTKGYQPTRFQFCRLSRSSFTEGLLKRNDDVMVTSFHTFGIQNFKYFVKLVISYQPTKFQISKLSNFYEGGGKHPPQTYTLSKSPVLTELRLLTHVGLVRQNVLIPSEVFLYVERSKNLEKKYVITVQKIYLSKGV